MEVSLSLSDDSVDATSVMSSSDTIACFGAESCFLPWNVLTSKLVKEYVLPSIRRSTSASQIVSGIVAFNNDFLLVAFNNDFLLGYPPATTISFWTEIA